MTTYLPPISVTTERRAARREVTGPRFSFRWLAPRRDGKIRMLAGVESLSQCSTPDLVALSAAADLFEVEEGTVLATGRELAQSWWMPIDGWLLLSGQGKQALTVPVGWSWLAPSRHLASAARLTALRGGRILTAPRPVLMGTLDEHPRLAEVIGSTLVGQS
jgi:hypothetical protein